MDFPPAIRLYLCRLGSNGLPELPAIDSVDTYAGNNYTSPVGGSFTSTVVRTVTTSFAVLVRNLGATTGDTVRFLRTQGLIPTNTSNPAFGYSDGYGFVAYQGQFYSTRNFTTAPGFGVGTDYEFMVAPRITYTIQSGQQMPTGLVSATNLITVSDTLCTRTPLTFTNTTSGFYEHRQYNLNQFYRKWNLSLTFPTSISNVLSPDSSVSWSFEFNTGGVANTLAYTNNHTLSVVTAKSLYPACFQVNQFRTRLKLMSKFGCGMQISYNEDFKICLKYCNSDATGITSLVVNNDLKICSNPLLDGKALLSGLSGGNSIEVFDLSGRVILNEVTERTTFEINLLKYAAGTYLVRINNSQSPVKVFKIINGN